MSERTSYEFIKRDAEVEIVERSRPTVSVWKGRPDGLGVLDVRPIPGAHDAIALLDFSRGDVSSNLIRLSAQGEIVWRLAGPEANDFVDPYVRMRVTRRHIFASSASGYYVKIDPTDGSIIESEFTK